jgi:zinc-ribbon domain
MVCRQCGTQIADKAIVCFRCGTPTAEPTSRPAAGRRPLARGPAALALLVLIVAALIMGQVPTAAVPREVGYALAGLAVVALGWQYFGRRR